MWRKSTELQRKLRCSASVGARRCRKPPATRTRAIADPDRLVDRGRAAGDDRDGCCDDGRECCIVRVRPPASLARLIANRAQATASVDPVLALQPGYAYAMPVQLVCQSA